MKLKLHELHISQHTIISLAVAENDKRGRFTDYGIAKVDEKHLYLKVQCSFMNMYKNSKFNKL